MTSQGGNEIWPAAMEAADLVDSLRTRDDVEKAFQAAQAKAVNDLETAGIATEEEEYFQDLAAAVLCGHPAIRLADGGAERCHSVLNALDVLAQQARDDDWVLVHDAARDPVER